MDKRYHITGYKADEIEKGMSLSSFARYEWCIHIKGKRGEPSLHESLFSALFPRVTFFATDDELFVLYFDSPEPELEGVMRLYAEDCYDSFSLAILPRVKAGSTLTLMALVKSFDDAMGSTLGVYTLREVTMRMIGKDKELDVLARNAFASFPDAGGMKDVIIAMADADLNVSRAASRCYLHRNTLINRLDMIEEALLLSPRKFHDEEALLVLAKHLK